MSTHPFIPLYVDDYDAATAHLTPAQDGIYGRLMRLCWRTPGCSLPNDEAWIARKVRLSAAEWQRVGKPVLDEFFKLQRGRLVQKRLKAEYDDISRKKSARKAAGKKGGEAKARKTQEKSPSIATVLPADTRASPEPNPEPEEEPPVAPQGAGGGQLALVQPGEPKARRCDPPAALVERLWSLQPVTGGKRKATRPEVAKALKPALDRGGTPEEIEAAFAAYYALPDCRRDEGRFARGAAVLLHDDKWRDFSPSSGQLPLAEALPSWPGPADLRAAIVAARDEGFARSYLDPAGWRNGPDRLVLCRNEIAAKRLSADVPEVLREFDVRAVAEASFQPDRRRVG